MNTTEHDTYGQLADALDALRTNRPNDRSSLDRIYAICITDMEKVLAYFHFGTLNELGSQHLSEASATSTPSLTPLSEATTTSDD